MSAATDPSTQRTARKKGFQRSATVSSTTPLRSKDVPISKERKAQFAALDLDTLLSEFKAVADTKKATADEEEEIPDTPSKSGGGGDDAKDARRWLTDSGFSGLAEMNEQGKKIGQSDILEVTEGYKTEIISSVNKRVAILNGLLGGGAAGGDDGAAAAASSDSMSRLKSLTESIDDPLTLFGQLGEVDQQRVQQINLVELTSILESSSGKKFKFGKSKKRKKQKGKITIFGTELETLYQDDLTLRKSHMEDESVPLFFGAACSFLEAKGLNTVGIFRKPGSASRMRALIEKCEGKCGVIDFEADKCQVVDVACLLKQFIRDVPEPLLTRQYLDAFSATQALESTEAQVHALALAVQLLPDAHQYLLRRLLQFLFLVAEHEAENQMGIPNLAVIFAPSLFFVKGQTGQKMLQEVEAQVVAASCVKMMIQFHHELWDVSHEILAHLRFLTEESNGARKKSTKDVKKLLKKKDKSTDALSVSASEDTEFTFWIGDGDVVAQIVVTRPDKSTRKLNVKVDDTVQTILDGVGCSSDELEERGGNIGSRVLDPRTKVVPMLNLNRFCELHVLL